MNDPLIGVNKTKTHPFPVIARLRRGDLLDPAKTCLQQLRKHGEEIESRLKSKV